MRPRRSTRGPLVVVRSLKHDRRKSGAIPARAYAYVSNSDCVPRENASLPFFLFQPIRVEILGRLGEKTIAKISVFPSHSRRASKNCRRHTIRDLNVKRTIKRKVINLGTLVRPRVTLCPRKYTRGGNSEKNSRSQLPSCFLKNRA